MNYRLLCRIFGLLLLLIGACMGACAGFGYWEFRSGVENHGTFALSLSASIAGITGVILFLVGFKAGRDILRKEAIIVVGLGWFVSAIFGMLPYVFCQPALSIEMALFESVSGFTTTGSTVIEDLTPYPRAILLWRSLTQWLGGVGILVLFVALLSSLGAGGKSLFRTESSAQSGESIHARVRSTALMLWGVYLLITSVTCVGLKLLGMGWFDAICHSMTCASTAGFSTYNESIAYFDSAGIDVFITVMMLVAGMSFFFHVAVIRRRWQRVKVEEEGRWFIGIFVVATLLVFFNLTVQSHHHESPLDALRHAAFQVSSILTTTGYATYDFDTWPGFSISVLLGLMVIGGCTGSTAGGIKVARVLFVIKTARRQIVAAFRPKQVFRMEVNKSPAESSAADAVFHVVLVGVCVFGGSMALALFEPAKDFDTAFSATLSTLGNIGPGIREVGPTKTFADFSAPSHVIMSLMMIMGRLELLAVLVLFVPSLWRKY